MCAIVSKPTLKVTKDFTKEMLAALKQLPKKETLVGIPSAENAREDGPIGNAAILFINEYGSPAQNIPARPVMAIGLAKVQNLIIEEFKKCAEAALTKGGGVYDKYFVRIGIIASSSIKNVIDSQDGIVGPSEATLAARESKGFMGTKALLVSGQLRNSITYAIRGKS